MTRVKRGVTTGQRHKRRLKETKGFRGLRNRIYSQANLAWMKAGVNAYVGRKRKKRDFRKLWIARISAGLKALNKEFRYSRLVNAMTKKKILVNRKIIADLALNHPNAFSQFVEKVLS